MLFCRDHDTTGAEKEKIQGNYDGGRFGFEEFMVILREGGGAIVIIPTQGGQLFWFRINDAGKTAILCRIPSRSHRCRLSPSCLEFDSLFPQPESAANQSAPISHTTNIQEVALTTNAKS
jgi:hypothetical protein